MKGTSASPADVDPEPAAYAPVPLGGSAAPAFDPSEEYRRLLESTDPALAYRRAKRGRAKQAQGQGQGTSRRRAAAGTAASGDSGEDDVYQFLMSRERRVLDTVDRVVNDAARADDASHKLLDMPVHEIIMRTASAVRMLFEDLVQCRSLVEVRKALHIEPARRPFVGLALVALALLVGMLQCCG
jgi:hypothetical protein